jgi:hypothetical protein
MQGQSLAHSKIMNANKPIRLQGISDVQQNSLPRTRTPLHAFPTPSPHRTRHPHKQGQTLDLKMAGDIRHATNAPYLQYVALKGILCPCLPGYRKSDLFIVYRPGVTIVPANVCKDEQQYCAMRGQFVRLLVVFRVWR